MFICLNIISIKVKIKKIYVIGKRILFWKINVDTIRDSVFGLRINGRIIANNRFNPISERVVIKIIFEYICLFFLSIGKK